MRKLKSRLVIMLLCCQMAAGSAHAGDTWYAAIGLNGMAGSYSGSVERDDLSSAGFWLSADYLDRFSLAFAYTGFNVNFKDTGSGAFGLRQDGYAGRMLFHTYSDSLRGRVSYGLVVHSITNNDPTGGSGDLTVIAPKIVYSSYGNAFYLDFEYARSDYANSGLLIQQFSPTVGFGFNDRFDFIRLRGFYIDSSDSTLSQGEDAVTSLSVKWTHWFPPGGFIGMDSLFVDLLGGQRMYAVDNDAFAVYNLADIQTGAALLGLNWRLGENFDITAVGGLEKYENRLINNRYDQPYIYISLTANW